MEFVNEKRWLAQKRQAKQLSEAAFKFNNYVIL